MRFLNIDKYLKACRELDGLFVISSQLKKYFISKGVSESKIDIINMTVDPSRFETLKKDPSEKYIAYCGKATNNKDGVDQLIKSFAITYKSFPNIKLYIIGSPPNRNDESGNLELVKSLGLEKNVVFTGVVSASDIPQLLKNAEILALDRPDNIQAQYGFPTKLGEYLLTGNPVVITSVGDVPLFLKDQESALIAPPNNPSEFAKKINYALNNPEKARAIGLKGKQIALANFNSMIESNKIISKLLQTTSK